MVDLIGLGAGLFVILAFYARSGLWLRRYAILSNVLFLIYAIGLELWPILILHGILLPLNLWRLSEHAVNKWAPLDQQMSEEKRLSYLRFQSIAKDSCGLHTR